MANIREIRRHPIYDIDIATIENCGDFDVDKTFDCGQAFRFDPLTDTQKKTLIPDFIDSNAVSYIGTAKGRSAVFVQGKENGVFHIIGSDEKTYSDVWEKYLSLDEDYDEINSDILSGMPNEAYRNTMQKAIDAGRGIRILRQDAWEALASFIISQNNNIPRIKKIVSAMASKFGDEIHFGNETFYSFPTAEKLMSGGIEALDEMKMGFRNKYIMDACDKVVSGEIDFEQINSLESFDDCLNEVTKIKGVGPKVGSCMLLFGMHRLEAFPVDVWIKKSLAVRFPDGIDISAFGRYAGIAQQYLFYYERYESGGNK